MNYPERSSPPSRNSDTYNPLSCPSPPLSRVLEDALAQYLIRTDLHSPILFRPHRRGIHAFGENWSVTLEQKFPPVRLVARQADNVGLSTTVMFTEASNTRRCWGWR